MRGIQQVFWIRKIFHFQVLEIINFEEKTCFDCDCIKIWQRLWWDLVISWDPGNDKKPIYTCYWSYSTILILYKILKIHNQKIVFKYSKKVRDDLSLAWFQLKIPISYSQLSCLSFPMKNLNKSWLRVCPSPVSWSRTSINITNTTSQAQPMIML